VELSRKDFKVKPFEDENKKKDLREIILQSERKRD